ncbi:MAG: riboflavin synthase [Gemmatimonadaceae bacterium]
MFTGLVESVGTIASVEKVDEKVDEGVVLSIDSSFSGLVDGESISVNGVCLTVTGATGGWFGVAAMVATMSRTTVGEWAAGRRVNLERAVRADSRLGGHIVQGHVDGVGTIEALEPHGDATLMDIGLPAGLSETLVLHGSIALDGVSLTVNRLEGDKLQVALIDYTLRNTTLGELRVGERVNVETDVIGKHVRALVAPYLNR